MPRTGLCGVYSAPVVVPPQSLTRVRMLPLGSTRFQLNSALSFESQHSSAQLISRDEAGRNFPGIHRFPPFSAELALLPHPHINTRSLHPGWAISVPITDQQQEIISIQGFPQPQFLSLLPFQCSPPSHQEGAKGCVGLGFIQGTAPGPLPQGGTSPGRLKQK